MPRKKLIRTREHVYHVTSRSNNKEWFYIPSNEAWKISLRLLRKSILKFKIDIHAFVLMNNHYHLMVKTPECDIDVFMQYFNRNMSLRINQSTGKINHVFGGPYKWSIINNNKYYLNALKYLYQNPVRAQIVSRVESYPYSTLNECQLGFKLKCYEDHLCLDWLNQHYLIEDQIRIKNGLRRTHFKPTAEKSSRRHIKIT